MKIQKLAPFFLLSKQYKTDKMMMDSNNNNNNMSSLSKASIVEWVNTSIEPNQHFNCVKDIPSKVAAAFMNDIFGDSAFPMRGVNFTAEDSDFQVSKKNCEAVLEGAALLGFSSSSFSASSWADGVKDFGGVLLFWRWLRGKSLEKPLTRVLSAADVGLVPKQNHNNQVTEFGPSSQQNNNNNNNTKNVVRLSDVMSQLGTTSAAGASGENSQPGGGSNNNSFFCGGQNGEIAKKLFDANCKELRTMRKIHEDLSKGVSEGNLNRIVQVLASSHNGMY